MKSTDHSAGTSHRIRLVPAMERANSVLEHKVTLRQFVELIYGLEVEIVRCQGQPNQRVKDLGATESFPLTGTEAITADGLQSILNYLTATAPEAA